MVVVVEGHYHWTNSEPELTYGCDVTVSDLPFVSFVDQQKEKKKMFVSDGHYVGLPLVTRIIA